MELKDKSSRDTNGKEDYFTQAIGKLGKWQIYQILIVVVPINITMNWNHFAIVFYAPKTIYRCVEINSTEIIKNSTCYSECRKYEYYSEFQNTIISQWDLICERAWLTSFSQAMYMCGILVGSIIFGFIADRYGRRNVILISCMSKLCLGFVIPFCPNYWSFVAIRFLAGCGTAGAITTCFVYMIEIVGPTKRELVATIYSIPLSLGYIIMSVFGYYLRTWDMYSLGIAVPNLMYLMYFFCIPESPMWLISVGRFEEASEVMTKAAKVNKLPAPNMIDIVKRIAEEKSADKSDCDHKTTYIDLLRFRSLRMKAIWSCMIWFLAGLSFYGSNQYLGQSSENKFLSVALIGIISIPGAIISGYLSKKIGRRISLIVLCIVSSSSNALLSLPNDWVRLKIAAGAVGVSCNSAIFGIAYIYTSELFPTVARTMAMGASSMISRIGSMLAPFVASLDVEIHWIAPMIFAIAPLLTAAICLCLPETRGITLEDHIDVE